MRHLAAGVALASLSTAAAADTLQEALLKAYQSNPTITAGRAALRATDENVPIARSQGLPGVNANGGVTDNVVQANNNFLNPSRFGNAAVNVSLPVYSGGAVKNGVRAAETRVEAGRASLRGTEANLFTNVVAAYMNVIRDEAVVGLNQQNVQVLQTNLQASRDRFQVGDLTRTDVAQSEARLALARAQLQSAEAQLITSRENYVELVGAAPVALQPPPELPNLPDSPQTAVTVALNNNPTLLAAQKQRDATRYDVAVAKANRLPKLALVTGGTYVNYLGSIPTVANGQAVPNSATAATAGVSFTLPLFQGGRPAAQVRQAEALQSQAIEQETGAERTVVARDAVRVRQLAVGAAGHRLRQARGRGKPAEP